MTTVWQSAHKAKHLAEKDCTLGLTVLTKATCVSLEKATLRLMSVQAVTVSAVVMRLTISCHSNADLHHYERVVCSVVNQAVGCGVPVVV